MSTSPAAEKNNPIFALAARQGALDLPFAFKGKPAGTLRQIQSRLTPGKPSAEEKALLAKLDALYRLGFNFATLSALPNQDLGLLEVPERIISHEIGLEVNIKRNTDHREYREPFLVFRFVHPSINKETNYIVTPYERPARSLSLYTCANIRIDEGKGLSRELIGRSFLTAARVLTALGEKPASAYAFFILDSSDYQWEGGPLQPRAQKNIGRIFGILGSMGFEEGFPSGSRETTPDNKAMCIGLAVLEDNFRQSFHQWTCARRFEKFAELLDQEELQAKFKAREEADWKVIEGKIKHWFGEDGTAALLQSGRAETQKLLAIFEDLSVSFDLAEEALKQIVESGELTRKVMVSVINVLKTSIFDPDADYPTDKDLAGCLYRHLPRKFHTLALQQKLGIKSTL